VTGANDDLCKTGLRLWRSVFHHST